MNEEALYSTIFNAIEAEDKKISELTQQGIFFAPELYIAFKLGKVLKQKEAEFFETNVTWMRETNLGNGGPSDIVFQTKNLIYVFEVKLRSTYHEYIEDIDKLKRLKGEQYQKYFIALVDTFKTQCDKDERFKELELAHPDILRISDFKFFHTEDNRYKSSICCTLGVWKIM